MPTIKYSNNPNSDTAFVIQDGGQKNRTVLTAEPAGTLQLSDSANVSTGYVTDEDGKKHKVNLVAQLEGDIEFSDNPNSTKGYATVDGKKHRVVLTASLHGGGGSAPAYYIEKTKDVNGVASNSSYLMDLSTFTDVGNFVFAYAYYGNTSITGTVNFSSLTSISHANACLNMFYGCTGLTGVDLSSLTTVTTGCNSMFYGCTGLTSVDLSSLLEVTGFSSIFFGCTGLTNIDLSSLTTIGASGLVSAFQNTALTNVDFLSLSVMTNDKALSAAFKGCTNLTSLYFYAVNTDSFGTKTSQLQNLVSGVNGCTIHFPSNLDPQSGSTVISSLTGYPNFGGTNTVLAFDLPATNHLIGADTVEYERSPKFDTATALAWRVNGTAVTATTYYTSTKNNPSVGATIYSDSACTTAVTTVASIA